MLQTEEVNYIDSPTLERFIEKHYGLKYKTNGRVETMSQDTAIVFTVDLDNDSSELWWDLDEESETYVNGPTRAFRRWLAVEMESTRTEDYPDVGTVLFDLARQGLAPEGKYVVHLWW